jgi:uncharacterized membrane protein
MLLYSGVVVSLVTFGLLLALLYSKHKRITVWQVLLCLLLSSILAAALTPTVHKRSPRLKTEPKVKGN